MSMGDYKNLPIPFIKNLVNEKGRYERFTIIFERLFLQNNISFIRNSIFLLIFLERKFPER